MQPQPSSPAQPSIPARIDVMVQPASPTAPTADHWNLIGTLAWPLVAALIVIVLRNGISDALKGLAARASKFSIGVVTIELAQSSARSPGPLEEIRDALFA